jgi:lipoate-protein ligase A
MNSPQFPSITWRLLISTPADGATNMATDEAIVRGVTLGQAPPTLRLYAWVPPCLSLGRGQSIEEIKRDACARDGVHIVRRPTGGRAILHTDELTYSVVAPPDDPRLTGDIITSYRRLSQALLMALQQLGVDAQARSVNRTTNAINPVCFEVPSHYELTTPDGRKLVGSAQMRTSDAVLQHGTIPLVGDIARICHYLVSPPAVEQVRARAATLESVLAQPVSWDQAAAAMVKGFSSALNLTLARGALTSAEQDWIIELCAEKYANSDWTARI